MVQLRDDIVGLDAAILSPAGGVGGLAATSRTSPTRWSTARCASSASASTSSTTRTSAPTAARRTASPRPAQFNLMFKTLRRSGGGGRRRGLPAPGDGPGHVRELRQRAADHAARSRRSASPRSARASATRSPRRTGSSAPASSSRWRWSTSCRRPRRRQWYEYWCAQRLRGSSTSASRRTCCGCAPTTPTSCRTTRRARPTWSSSSRGDGTSWRASPTAGDYDLTQHATHSGERLEYFDQATGERYVPHVIEPAAGATRTMAAFLLAAYDEDEIGGEARTVLRLHPRLAPYQVAVLPAVEEGDAGATAREVVGLAAAPLHGGLRRHPVDRAAVPAPGRDRHAAGA